MRQLLHHDYAIAVPPPINSKKVKTTLAIYYGFFPGAERPPLLFFLGKVISNEYLFLFHTSQSQLFRSHLRTFVP